MRRLLPLLLVAAWAPALSAQIVANWDTKPYVTDSALVFHDDLDFYLNSYSKQEIKSMRRMVSIWRMNFDKVIRATIDDIRTHSEGAGVATRTKDFELPVAQTGARYRLSADQGLGWTLAEGFKERFLTGSDELALVRSGLDDTMRTAYQAMREIWHSRQDVEDLRVAAYIVSIGRVAQTYRSKGL